MWTAGALLHRRGALPPRARHATWVAEEDRTVVGWAEAEFDWTAEVEGVGTLYVLVAPDRRLRGIGSSLFEVVQGHLTANGARELRSWSVPDGESFLERHGFRRTREERISAVDPRTVDTGALDVLPEGVAVVALPELEHRLPEVHAVYAAAAGDMPADHPETNLPYDEWLIETLGDPDLAHDGSAVVLVDDRVAALSWLRVDRRRGLAEHDLTGTARTHRRRGLARLAKLAVIRWAAANGVTRLTTGNDATNAGMLAINDELGFRPFAVETEWVKPLP